MSDYDARSGAPQADGLPDGPDNAAALGTALPSDDEGSDDRTGRPTRPDYSLCPTCQGHGSIVNPAVDVGGLTREDFEREGPDFEDAYFSGVYDIACPECRGLRVVTSARHAEYLEEEADARTQRMESGIWEY